MVSDGKVAAEELSANEIEMRSEATLKRLLAMPPQPKPKNDASASPKKRGRPAKAKPA